MEPRRNTLLRVDDLRANFPANGSIVRALDGVSFDLEKGETLGIVGESGSGKSVLNLSLMGLVPEPGRVSGGRVELDGTDLLQLSPREMRKLRGRRIAMVFQDPMASLNPYLKVSTQLTEITRLHLGHTRGQARRHAAEML